MEKTSTQKEFYAEFKEVRAFLYDFFDNYYIKRNPDRILEMMSDNVLCIGMGKTEIAKNIKTFEKFMRAQMQGISEPLPYDVKDYIQIPSGNHFWTCYAEIEIIIRREDWGKVDYDLRLTATVHKENGKFVFDLIHTSEANGYTNNYCILDSRCSEEGKINGAFLVDEQRRILNHLVPGGVVSNYIDEGYPISFANEQFLRITDFDDFDELSEFCQGEFLNLIHPDDVERYKYNADFVMESGKQCECEYRIKKKDGKYIWVHDIAHHAVAGKGNGVIVSALVNIQDQMDLRNKLESQSRLDSLTGIFNRKYGEEKIEQKLKEGLPYLFCLIDLDNFKEINDIYGHQSGDTALRYIASKLVSSFRTDDVVFRLGGDEFVIFVSGYSDPEAIKGKLNEIAKEYREKMKDYYPSSNSSVSAGGIFGQKEYSFSKLYKLSDDILYKIKNEKKNKIIFKEI